MHDEAMDIVDPPDPREGFRALLAAYEAAQRAVHGLGDPEHPLVLEMEAALLAAEPRLARRKSTYLKSETPGRRRMNYEAVAKVLGMERAEEIVAPFKVRATAIARQLQVEMADAAQRVVDAAAPSLLRPCPGARLVLSTIYPSTYASQTNSESYARGAAESSADVARYYGIEVGVVRVEGEEKLIGTSRWRLVTYEVRVGVEEELDLAILRRLPGPPLREWVRLCWARGVNPRVFSPFLPHGFEEQNGLDFFGRDLTGARAPATEASDDHQAG